jgi:hypothetical protein
LDLSTATRASTPATFTDDAHTPYPLPPIPTPQLITPAPLDVDTAGWQRVETNSATFFLPVQFEVIDLGSGFSELFGAFAGGLVEGMSEFAQGFVGEGEVTPTPFDASGLEEALSIDFVLAIDADGVSSVVLLGQPVEGDPDLSQLMQEMLEGFEGSIQILAWQVLQDSAIPTGRIELFLDDPAGAGQGRVLIYVYRGASRSWSLIFQTQANEFPGKLNEFEAIAASFETG